MWYYKINIHLYAGSEPLDSLKLRGHVLTYLKVGMSLFCFFSHLFFFPVILLFSTYFSEYFA